MQISSVTPKAATPVRPAIQKSNPVEELPDLDTIETRAAELQSPAATTPVESSADTKPSKAKIGALAALTLGTALMAAAPAQAHGYGYGYGYGHHHHHHQNNNLGAFLGGLLLGGALGSMSPPPPPVYYPPQPVYRTPFYNNYGQLICPANNGGWYVSPNNMNCW